MTPGFADGSRLVALEEHVWTGELRDALTKDGSDDTVKLMRSWPGVDDLLRDVGESRLQKMADAGVDAQVLSITSPGTQPLEPAEAVPLARDANSYLAEAVSARPDRFTAFATLPTSDPEAAARELERAVNELGMVGAMIFPRTGDRYLDHEAFRPIFESAAGLGVPLYLHPQLPPRAVRDVYFRGFGDELDLLLAAGGWGWHAEAGLTALRLILTGTFDRHPGLQLMLGHWGEMLVPFLERANVLSGRATHLERSIADYITGNVLVTAGGIYSHRMLQDAMAAVGADRVLFSADYPFHPDAGGDARRFLRSAPISPDDRAKIAHGNAKRLGLAPTGPPGQVRTPSDAAP